MRYSADDIHSKIESANGVGWRVGAAVEAILRKSDELKIKIGSDFLLHLKQSFDGKQAVIANIDMGPNRQKTHGNGPVAIGKRPVDHGFLREQRFELAPERYALQQGSGSVDAWDAIGKCGVHVEMSIDEGR